MTRRPVALIILLGALMGCSSAPDRYYTLMPEPAARATAAAASQRVIVVGPVTIPARVDQAQLVVSLGGHQIDVREAERWSAPLKDEFSAALAARLQALLPAATVAAYHQSAGLDAPVRVLVDVSRFDLGPGQQTSLDALWTIKTAEPASQSRGHFQVAVPARGPGYDRLAEAQGVALDRLAQTIATTLRATEH